MFAVGNSSDTTTWATAPTPALINTYPGRGPNGSTQITIIWDPNVIQNQWLRVTVLAQPHLGLLADDVFYFGNAIGDTGNSSLDAQGHPADAKRRHRPNTAAPPTSPTPTTSTATASSIPPISPSPRTTRPPPPPPSTSSPPPTAPTSPPSPPLPTPRPSPSPKPPPSLPSGADSLGESTLTYTWAAIGTPPAHVSFSNNGTNAAKNSTATFNAAGTYTLQVTTTNASNNAVTSTITVQVNQTATSILVTPASATIIANATDQLSALALDQFNNPMASPTHLHLVHHHRRHHHPRRTLHRTAHRRRLHHHRHRPLPHPLRQHHPHHFLRTPRLVPRRRHHWHHPRRLLPLQPNRHPHRQRRLAPGVSNNALQLTGG